MSAEKSLWINERNATGQISINGKSFATGGVTYPADEMLEQRVIGELLAAGELDEGNDLFRTVCALVRHTDFFFMRYAVTYEAITHIVESGEKFDVLSVATYLRQRIGNVSSALEYVGGEKALYEIANTVPMHTSTHARNVLRLSLRRTIILTGKIMSDLANNTNNALDELIEQFQVMNRELQARFAALDGNSLVTRSVWERYINQIFEDIDNPQFEAGIPIWLDDLQNMLQGWQKRKLYVIGAGTNMGKSTFMYNAALDAARLGKKIVFVSLETPPEQLAERLIGIEARVDSRHLQNRILNSLEIQNLLAAARRLSAIFDNFRVLHFNRPTISQIQGKIDALWHDDPFDIIFIDYVAVETTTASADERYQNDKQHADQMWMAVGDFRKLFNTPVVVATQVNRNYMNNQDKRPLRTDIANSSLCEKTADALLLLHRMSMVDNMGVPNLADITIEKNRSGPAGITRRFDITFDEYTGRISNITDNTAAVMDQLQ